MKKLWVAIASLFGFILYFLASNKAQEVKLKIKDKKLDNDIKNNNDKIKIELNTIAALPKPVSQELTPGEVESYWNSKDKK
jgi:hypothetical protein